MLTLPHHFSQPKALLDQFQKLLERKALYCRQLYDRDASALPEAEGKRLTNQINALEAEIELLYRVQQLLKAYQDAHNAKIAELEARWAATLGESERRRTDLVELYHAADAAERELLHIIEIHIPATRAKS